MNFEKLMKDGEKSIDSYFTEKMRMANQTSHEFCFFDENNETRITVCSSPGSVNSNDVTRSPILFHRSGGGGEEKTEQRWSSSQDGTKIGSNVTRLQQQNFELRQQLKKFVTFFKYYFGNITPSEVLEEQRRKDSKIRELEKQRDGLVESHSELQKEVKALKNEGLDMIKFYQRKMERKNNSYESLTSRCSSLENDRLEYKARIQELMNDIDALQEKNENATKNHFDQLAIWNKNMDNLKNLNMEQTQKNLQLMKKIEILNDEKSKLEAFNRKKETEIRAQQKCLNERNSVIEELENEIVQNETNFLNKTELLEKKVYQYSSLIKQKESEKQGLLRNLHDLQQSQDNTIQEIHQRYQSKLADAERTYAKKIRQLNLHISRQDETILNQHKKYSALKRENAEILGVLDETENSIDLLNQSNDDIFKTR